jgi:protein-disulfide isomerase
VKQSRGGGSRRGFNLALLVVAVLGVGGIVWATQRSKAAAVVTIPSAPVAAQAEGYVRGDPNAPVEIVEYADFECPGCGQFATVTEPDVVKRLVETGQARYRFYDFPVNGSHRNSGGASLAAACANDQGKFWEMHDRLFLGQTEWSTYATDDPKPSFARYAREIGLDAAKWEQCYDARTHVDRIAAHQQEATRNKVGSTPTFIIGDKMLAGAQPFDVIKAMVDSARAAGPAPRPATDSAARAPAVPTAGSASGGSASR